MYAKELLPQIKANGRSDKYSENLMKWVKKQRRLPLFVAYSPTSCLDGSDLGPFAMSKTLASQLYIGYGELDQGFLHGSRLSEILCEGARSKEWAFGPHCRFEVLPDWFQGYIDGGKCFIDPEHRLYGGERWQVADNGNTRLCLWCGLTQQKRVEQRIVEDVYWDNLGL